MFQCVALPMPETLLHFTRCCLFIVLAFCKQPASCEYHRVSFPLSRHFPPYLVIISRLKSADICRCSKGTKNIPLLGASQTMYLLRPQQEVQMAYRLTIQLHQELHMVMASTRRQCHLRTMTTGNSERFSGCSGRLPPILKILGVRIGLNETI